MGVVGGSQYVGAVLALAAVVMVAVAPYVWGYLRIAPAVTVTETYVTTLTETRYVPNLTVKIINNTVTQTEVVPLINYSAVTVTQFVPLYNATTTVMTVTTTELTYWTVTQTKTKTVTTTQTLTNFREVNKDYFLTALNNAQQSVYAYITYYGGYVTYDQRFDTLTQKLIQLTNQGLDIRILILKPVICQDWPPGAVGPQIIQKMYELSLTLGTEHVRAISSFSTSQTLPFYGDEAVLIIDKKNVVIMNAGSPDYLLDEVPNETVFKFEHDWDFVQGSQWTCNP